MGLWPAGRRAELDFEKAADTRVGADQSQTHTGLGKGPHPSGGVRSLGLSGGACPPSIVIDETRIANGSAAESLLRKLNQAYASRRLRGVGAA
jgi:hypothetical protein